MSSVAAVSGQIYGEPIYNKTRYGTDVANITLRDIEYIKKKNGDVISRTNNHKVTVFGELVEKIKSSIKRGDDVTVYGSLRTQLVKTVDGSSIIATELIADKIDFFNARR